MDNKIDTPFWQSHPVTKRLDGTFEIAAENGHPYQVCPKEIDPAGAYDFDDVSVFWATLPAADPRKLTEPEPEKIIVTMDQAQAFKLAEIIAGSNAAAAYLKSRYSEAEAESWSQQEAGARAILGNKAEVKNDAAALILKDETHLTVAMELVRTLAAIDGVTGEQFAARIVANADAAHQAKILTLTEQRSHEKVLKDVVMSGDVSAVQALEIIYSLPPTRGANG